MRNDNSTATMSRVVFDASCKTESDIGSNEVLLKGPVIQDELLYMLSRFRTYKFAFAADIKKINILADCRQTSRLSKDFVARRSNKNNVLF